MKISCKPMDILFVGGDLRQIRAINETKKRGNNVSVLGFDTEHSDKFSEGVQLLNDFTEISEEYNGIVLPLPYSSDGKNINTPLYRYSVSVTEFFENISPKNRILAGRCDHKIKAMAENHRIMLTDYLCREELATLNAIPTAEGAIQIAMEETDFTIHSSRCLVIGNGRIGKVLSKMIHGIGAEVTVASRKKGDQAYSFAMGYNYSSISSLGDKMSEFDIVFNTVPTLILDFDLLAKMKNGVLIIDLASKPGGVDFGEARRRGIKVIWALSLPGKVAPDTAGDIICNTILNILEETEVN